MRELCLVICVMGVGYGSLRTMHQVVGRFLERPFTPDVAFDADIDIGDTTQGLTRAEILANARKCGLEGRRYLPAEKEWFDRLSTTPDEQQTLARFARRSASVSGNDDSDPVTLTVQ